MEPIGLIGSTEEEYITSEKHSSHYRNVIQLSFAFFFLFFSFNSSQVGQTVENYAQTMQTTLDEKLGYINLGCLYCMFAFFSVFGPRIVSYFGPSSSFYSQITG